MIGQRGYSGEGTRGRLLRALSNGNCLRERCLMRARRGGEDERHPHIPPITSAEQMCSPNLEKDRQDQ